MNHGHAVHLNNLVHLSPQAQLLMCCQLEDDRLQLVKGPVLDIHHFDEIAEEGDFQEPLPIPETKKSWKQQRIR